MEDQTTWKGHSFTLVVFTGIVVLCSIFFILGMLVGRGQGQKIAGAATIGGLDTKPVPRPDPEDQATELSIYESSVGKEKPPVLEAPAAKPEPRLPDVPRRSETSPKPAPADGVNYQISALSKAADAQKLMNELKKKGLRAFILAPLAGDPNPLFRVQVGPFDDMAEAEQVKKKLESAGYRPILKK